MSDESRGIIYPHKVEAAKAAMHRGGEMIALLRAAATVRDGRWIKGAPTHVLAELLQSLEENGWRLVHDPASAPQEDP